MKETKQTIWVTALVLFSGLLLAAAPGVAQQFNYFAIDVSCSAETPPALCPAGIAPGGVARTTIASGISPVGDIVGSYTDGLGRQHGFLFTGWRVLGGQLVGGRFITIDVSGASGPLPTSANGINAQGDIVGIYTAPVNAAETDPSSPAYCPGTGSPACTKGFLYRSGQFSTVLFPGHPGAIPQRIASDGTIYGCLHDFDLMASMFGATWTRFGSFSLTANGGQLADSSASVPISMNNGGTPGGQMVVGLWSDMALRRHGYIVRNGVFESYDVPNSLLTAIWDVNPEQQFVGVYVDSSNRRHGFLQLPDGSAPINVDFPGAAATTAFGISPSGVIVGQYVVGGLGHGFVAVPEGN